ncbi:MAG: hypothetical protein FWH04_05755 [Oscillospiraceae bacterium]|nr:hypothetical protein [Oscillospiraceae bacterium]
MENFIEITIFILIALLSYWISAIVHELGHIVVGLANGWKLFILVVGFVGLKRKDEKLALYFEKNPVMWGGAGGIFPIKEDENNIKIWSKVLLGGPIASITMGIIFVTISALHSHIVWLLLGAMLIGMGIACLLPLKTGITYTDGKRWYRLRNGGQGQAEEIAIFKMTEIEQLGKDKSEIQKEAFEALLNAELPALRYYGNYYLYQYYIANNDDENKANTLEILNDMKSKVPKIIIDDCLL